MNCEYWCSDVQVGSRNNRRLHMYDNRSDHIYPHHNITLISLLSHLDIGGFSIVIKRIISIDHWLDTIHSKSWRCRSLLLHIRSVMGSYVYACIRMRVSSQVVVRGGDSRPSHIGAIAFHAWSSLLHKIRVRLLVYLSIILLHTKNRFSGTITRVPTRNS